jgi:hypothetical protein
VGGVYQIISTILANMLKSVLIKIVLSSQNAFIRVEICILSWWLMNVWIVKLDLGNLECCVNWIWKRHMIMLIVEEMWFWGEMARLDSALHIYGAVFHSH